MSTPEYELEIIKALNNRLRQFEGGAYDGKIWFQDDTFNTQGKQIWLKQDTIFADPTMIGVFTSGTYRLDLEYRVSVFVQNGKGSYQGLSLASKVRQWFPRGQELTSGGVTVKIEESKVRGSQRESAWVFHPVIIRCWAYAPYQS